MISVYVKDIYSDSEDKSPEISKTALNVGDAVFGIVLNTSPDQADVSIMGVEGKGVFGNRIRGQILNTDIVALSQVGDQAKMRPIDPAAYFGKFDIVIATVTSSEEPYDLSVKEDRRCGVISALCPETHQKLVPVGFNEMAAIGENVQSLDKKRGMRVYNRFVSPIVAHSLEQPFEEMKSLKKKNRRR